MELMEAITGPTVDLEGCPFPHEEEEWETYENEFLGDGGELGRKMETEQQTILNKEMGGGKPLGYSVLNPTKDPDSEYQLLKDRPIKLGGLLEGQDTLPLTCAAHHLIPAQASLKPSSLAKFLYHGSAQFKEGKKQVTVGGGKLVANVGYDVNGSQNGVWLPGPYALSGVAVTGEKPQAGKKKRGTVATLKTKMTSLASQTSTIEDTDDEDRPAVGVGLAPVPAGTRPVGPQKVEVSYYFLYTVAAMSLVAAQYHDAHTKYNKFVLGCLNKIAIELNAFGYEGLCDQCPKRNPDDQLPPPYAVTERLNLVSARLRNYLLGSPMSWHPEIFTSAMSLEFSRKEFRNLRLSDIENA